MANEKKAVCGGFLIGDGLQMDGKVLSATGGGEGIHLFNIEQIGEEDGNAVFLIHGMNIDDLYGIYFLHGIYNGVIITSIYGYGYVEQDGVSVTALYGLGEDSYKFGVLTNPTPYLDGIKVISN